MVVATKKALSNSLKVNALDALDALEASGSESSDSEVLSLELDRHRLGGRILKRPQKEAAILIIITVYKRQRVI